MKLIVAAIVLLVFANSEPNAAPRISGSYVAQGSAAAGSIAAPRRDAEKTIRTVVLLVAQQLGIEETRVSLDANFVADLGADSLDTVEILMALEDAFEIEIPDEDARRIVNVRSAVDYVLSHPNKRAR